MHEYRVASRYAKSLLELAEETKCLDKVNDDFALFSNVCASNRDFVLMLENPIVPTGKKLEVLRKLFSGKVQDLTIKMFELLAKKTREKYLPSIAQSFHEQYLDFKGIVEASVISVLPLNDTVKQSLIDTVKKITQKDVILNESIDETLIGGYVLTIGDQQIDESISSKLGKMRLELA